MNILLINPPADSTAKEFADEHGKSFIEIADFGAFPPLGLLYILGYLKKHLPNDNLFFIDCVAERINIKGLEKATEIIKPDVVGISSFTIGLFDSVRVARMIRTAFPNAHICLGGHHAMAFPREAANLDYFDSVVVGEGEVTFTKLIEQLKNNEPVEQVAGVLTGNSIGDIEPTWSREKNQFIKPKIDTGQVPDLEDLPFPDRDFIGDLHYRSIVGTSSKFTTMLTSRGCPFGCTFCDSPYKKYRERSLEGVMEEICDILSRGYKEIHFYDDLFNHRPEWIEKLSEDILRHGLKFHWSFRGRVAGISSKNMKLARRAGLHTVTFGVETGSDQGLKLLKKGITIGMIRSAFAACRAAGVRTIADFIIGFPFEKTVKDVSANLDFLYSLDPDYAQIGILALYPHTELFNDACQKGIIDPKRWENYLQNPYPDFKVDHWEEHLSLGELARLQRGAYRKFYLRPDYIFSSLLGLKSTYEFSSKIRGALKLLSPPH